MAINKLYLGDGAYVQTGSWIGEAVLTTENGVKETNRIVLGPDEMLLLGRWWKARALEAPGEERDGDV